MNLLIIYVANTYELIYSSRESTREEYSRSKAEILRLNKANNDRINSESFTLKNLKEALSAETALRQSSEKENELLRKQLDEMMSSFKSLSSGSSIGANPGTDSSNDND